jgi:hypothetical protein
MLYWDGTQWSPHRRPAFGPGAQAPSRAPRPAAHPPRSPHQLVHGLDNTFLTGIAVVALMAVIAFGVFLAWAQPAGSEESYAAGFAAAEDGPARTMFEANKDAVASCETAWDAEKKFADFHTFSRMSFTEGCQDALEEERPRKPADRPI